MENIVIYLLEIYIVPMKRINKKYNVKSTVLQIPHHGSYTSSSEQFLKKVGAKYAVISCGKNNPYNHPRPEAMRRIKNISVIKIYIEQIRMERFCLSMMARN